MELDDDTIEMLGFGCPNDRLVHLIYAQRLSELKAKANSARDSKDHTRKRHKDKVCPMCQRQFDKRDTGWLRTFCSDKCRTDFHNKKVTERRRDVLGKRPDTCETCSSPLVQNFKTKVKRFCSDRCRRAIKYKYINKNK